MTVGYSSQTQTVSECGVFQTTWN